MFKNSLLLFISVLMLVSCNANADSNGDPKSFSELKTAHEKLASDFKAVNEEFQILKQGLEKRGLSIAQMKAEMEEATKVYDIPVGSSPVNGKADAPIVIVEFTDFQCPYCARVAPELEKLTKEYPTKIKHVFKHFPLSFHKLAPAAHAASMAAQKQNKFWEFRYAVSDSYKTLSEADMLAAAKKAGLNIEKFKKDMVLDDAKKKILQEDEELGRQVNVRGTPSFYVNGKKAERFSPEMIKEMISKL
jgi:protein-disulfide isomerase